MPGDFARRQLVAGRPVARREEVAEEDLAVYHPPLVVDNPYRRAAETAAVKAATETPAEPTPHVTTAEVS